MLMAKDDLGSPFDRKTFMSNAKGEGQKMDAVTRVKVYKDIKLFEDGNCADLSDC